MSRKRRLEEAYKNLKVREIPDLWERIESGIEPKSTEMKNVAMENQQVSQRPRKYRIVYGAALAAACCIILIVRSRVAFLQKYQAEIAGEATTARIEATAGYVEESKQDGMSWEQGGNRVVRYEDLSVSGKENREIPEGAVCMSEDEFYFSEDVLRDAGLLCEVSVEHISFEKEADGTVGYVVYDVVIDKVLYSEDYMNEKERIQVKSPLVNGGADEVYLLYQLKESGRYILPLKLQDGTYWLLLPFAPQIEVTRERQYVFHTGWQSLVNNDTRAVQKDQASTEDFYFDRMVLREDEAFLSDLIVLVEAEHKK